MIHVSVERLGWFWRRRWMVRCNRCGPVSYAPTEEIALIRAPGHALICHAKASLSGH